MRGQRTIQRSFECAYLARSAARNPAAATIIVWGAPFFLEADHNLVGLPEYFSKKPGRLSMVLGFSHDVVSWIAFAEDTYVRFEYNEWHWDAHLVGTYPLIQLNSNRSRISLFVVQCNPPKVGCPSAKKRY
jgi:hypothetical protein